MIRMSTLFVAVMASASPANATLFAAPMALAPAAESLSEGVRHPVVSACYKKKVCAKWVTHTSGGYSSHYCAEYTMKTVCDPDLLIGSKAPPNVPPQVVPPPAGPPRLVAPPRGATPMHFRAQVTVRAR